MVDFGTAVGIVASVLGILTACITAYLSVTPPTGLVEKAERVRNETREYLQKVQADGLVQEVFFATTSHNIADIELDVMELHGVLYQERPWFKRLAFWVTTWINVRIYCRNLKQIQADIALHASTFRREKERSLQALKSEASAHVKSEDLDDDAKLPTFPLGDAVLDQLECGTLASSPPSKHSVTARIRQFVFIKANPKRCWSAVRAKVGAPRVSKQETPSDEVGKRISDRRRRLTGATLVEPYDATYVEKKDDDVAPSLPPPDIAGIPFSEALPQSPSPRPSPSASNPSLPKDVPSLLPLHRTSLSQ